MCTSHLLLFCTASFETLSRSIFSCWIMKPSGTFCLDLRGWTFGLVVKIEFPAKVLPGLVCAFSNYSVLLLALEPCFNTHWLWCVWSIILRQSSRLWLELRFDYLVSTLKPAAPADRFLESEGKICGIALCKVYWDSLLSIPKFDV